MLNNAGKKCKLDVPLQTECTFQEKVIWSSHLGYQPQTSWDSHKPAYNISFGKINQATKTTFTAFPQKHTKVLFVSPHQFVQILIEGNIYQNGHEFTIKEGNDG